MFPYCPFWPYGKKIRKVVSRNLVFLGVFFWYPLFTQYMPKSLAYIFFLRVKRRYQRRQTFFLKKSDERFEQKSDRFMISFISTVISRRRRRRRRNASMRPMKGPEYLCFSWVCAGGVGGISQCLVLPRRSFTLPPHPRGS